MAEESVEERMSRAENAFSPKELEKLVTDKDESVRRGVADNENSPVSVLEKLAAEKKEGIMI